MSLVPRRPLAAIAALGAAALIAGCGGGSDSLSADDFREQADDICADANARTGALTAPSSDAELLPYLQSGLTISTEQLERIRALDPPDDLQTAFDEATDLIQQRQDVVRKAADRISAGEDPDAVIAEVTPEIRRLRDEARAKARELGLTVCGSGEDDGSTAPATSDTAPQTSGTAPAQGGQSRQYVTDVQAAGTALQGFGTVLQGTTSLDDLRSRVPEANAALDEFEAAISKLEGYTLDNATLEKQRAGLAETGPEVSDTLRRFVAAAESGDPEAVQALVPEVTQAISAFQAAATTTP